MEQTISTVYSLKYDSARYKVNKLILFVVSYIFIGFTLSEYRIYNLFFNDFSTVGNTCFKCCFRLYGTFC